MSDGAADQWVFNDDGYWCPACGYQVARVITDDPDDLNLPESCRQCGFPDFEDGVGYFI